MRAEALVVPLLNLPMRYRHYVEGVQHWHGGTAELAVADATKQGAPRVERLRDASASNVARRTEGCIQLPLARIWCWRSPGRLWGCVASAPPTIAASLAAVLSAEEPND